MDAIEYCSFFTAVYCNTSLVLLYYVTLLDNVDHSNKIKTFLPLIYNYNYILFFLPLNIALCPLLLFCGTQHKEKDLRLPILYRISGFYVLPLKGTNMYNCATAH